MFDKKRHVDAIRFWEQAAECKMTYGTLFRNLGIAYWNIDRDGEKAREAFIKALDLTPNDTRILPEYDQLRKKLNDDPAKRLNFLESRKADVLKRDERRRTIRGLRCLWTSFRLTSRWVAGNERQHRLPTGR